MLAIVLVPATALLAVWFWLLGQASNEDQLIAAYCKMLDNQNKIQELRQKDIRRSEFLSTLHGIEAQVMTRLIGGTSEKKIQKLVREGVKIQKGELAGVGMLEMPGYVLQRKYQEIGKGNIHKKLLSQCSELYGKKYAANKTKQLLAKMLSYPIFGTAMALIIGVLFGTSDRGTGLLVMAVGIVLVFVLTYAVYNDMTSKLEKRRNAISRQFPNVVSKLALLVTSGMIMDRAWRETAESQNTELYIEMQKTADELSNLIDPMVAYTSFINRCNTKETTKLASAIIQNLSKGNIEIGNLLKTMAYEAWQERRHNARRDSEKANAKLMIPTLLLFAGILMMVMVPVVMNFSVI